MKSESGPLVDARNDARLVVGDSSGPAVCIAEPASSTFGPSDRGVRLECASLAIAEETSHVLDGRIPVWLRLDDLAGTGHDLQPGGGYPRYLLEEPPIDRKLPVDLDVIIRADPPRQLRVADDVVVPIPEDEVRRSRDRNRRSADI